MPYSISEPLDMPSRLPRRIYQPRAFALAIFACLAACSFIAPYDQAAYDKATGAKATALALMNKATDSYSSHQKDADAASLEIDKA